MELKVLPHDIEIEQSVLAGCILFPEIREECTGLITSADFYRTSHVNIFKAIKYLDAKGLEIDLVSVVMILKEKKLLDSVGGPAYIAEISDTAPVPANVKEFCVSLKNTSRLRNIIKICNDTQLKCYDTSNDSVELINNFQAVALNLDDEIKPIFTSKPELTMQSIDRYQKAMEGQYDTTIKTGYFLFDKYLGGGFKGAKLVIIAARPGAGKTALMCNLIENMCKKNIHCGVFSLEMSKEELDDRWISSGAEVNSMSLLTKDGLDAEEWQRVMNTADKHSRWNMTIDDQGNLNIDEIKRRARKMKKIGVNVIFIDQLSKIGGNRKTSVFERNTDHVEELGFLKKELGIPIVLLAQLNRDLEKRTKKKPMLSDLKNTGQLEEEADIVFLGYRKFIHTRNEIDKNHAEWEIAKNRQGATTNIEMYFNDKRMRFEQKAY